MTTLDSLKKKGDLKLGLGTGAADDATKANSSAVRGATRSAQRKGVPAAPDSRGGGGPTPALPKTSEPGAGRNISSLASARSKALGKQPTKSKATNGEGASESKFGIGALRPSREIKFSDLKYVGTKGGSNPGGKFRHKDGTQYILKIPQEGGDKNAKNEVLMGKLYELAGIEVPELNLIKIHGKVNGTKYTKTLGVVSTLLAGKLRESESELTSGENVPGLYDGFATDAWLAHWDVVGLDYDNLPFVSDKKSDAERVVRIDVGGAGLFRAQGRAKTGFDGKVGELKTMRSSATAEQAGYVFDKMTKQQLERSAAFVVRIPDEDIRQTVTKHGPGSKKENQELAKTLIARKAYIAKKYPNAINLAKDL